MLGTGENVEATPDLIFKKKLVDAIWKVIYGKKGLMPQGRFGRTNCNKCGDDHRAHASKSEIEWDLIARKYLAQVEGLFDVDTQ